jgi:hypothetical protein
MPNAVMIFPRPVHSKTLNASKPRSEWNLAKSRSQLAEVKRDVRPLTERKYRLDTLKLDHSIRACCPNP